MTTAGCREPGCEPGDGSWKYLFTVFTPTYQRATTLHRVYNSLRSQTIREFEWLIVDDGSTDGTEQLVAGWIRRATFPIRYIWQPNRGKHAAFNRGVQEAEGELFLTLDSDDSCMPESLSTFKRIWNAIPDVQRARFSAVTCLCRDAHGMVVGDQFPRDVLDSDSAELRFRYSVSGEKWGFQRTEVLRRFPFPENVRGYVPEGLVWRQIARSGLKTRFVNIPLRIYTPTSDSLSLSSPQSRAEGAMLLYSDMLNNDLKWFRFAPLFFLRGAAQFTRFSLHCHALVRGQVQALRSWQPRVMWAAVLPLGLCLYARDLYREWRSRRTQSGE